MRRGTTFLFCMLLLSGLPGCLVLDVAVSNPAPNLPRVAVAPFVNLSTERSVDGRRFAEAYYTELQKVPGFQVIPVGVVESALHDYGLNLDTPTDLEKLIQILNVDAVCFGAITEYNPYYPPRLGLQVSWYSLEPPHFVPGLPLHPDARKHHHRAVMLSGPEYKWARKLRKENFCLPGFPCANQPKANTDQTVAIRGQNAEADLASEDPAPLTPAEQKVWEQELRQALGMEVQDSQREIVEPLQNETEQIVPVQAEEPENSKSSRLQRLQELLRVPEPPVKDEPKETQSDDWGSKMSEWEQGRTDSEQSEHSPALTNPQNPQTLAPSSSLPPAAQVRLPGESPNPWQPRLQPYMSYTRVFDGADADFTAALKNYLELSGDQRSGGWTGYLHRSEDFIRFCMHQMIEEMLLLHGGESQKRVVLTSRKYQ